MPFNPPQGGSWPCPLARDAPGLGPRSGALLNLRAERIHITRRGSDKKAPAAHLTYSRLNQQLRRMLDLLITEDILVR